MIITPTQKSLPHPNSRNIWFAIFLLGIITLVFIVAGAGSFLNYIFPAGAFAVGVFIYRADPVMYISYSWWISFLTPFVRRLADWRGSWTDPSPILLAPVVVSLICVVTLVYHFPKVYTRSALPFTLCLAAVTYGFLIGISNKNPLTGTILSFIGWLSPILFGFHIYINWQQYPKYRQNIQRTFFWAVLIIGLYGVIQYFSPFEWDKHWLTNVRNEKGIVTFGTPEPQGIRVFSTLNAPQTLGGALMAGLLLLFSSQKNPLRFPAIGIGYLCFLLSSARSAWLSWAVGLLVYIPLMKQNLQIRLIISIAIAAVFVIPLASIEPFSTVINGRLNTFSNISSDSSYNSRLNAYSGSLDQALVEVIGRGMGLADDFGAADNGVLTLLFTLGWLAAIPYIAGLAMLFWKAFSSTIIRQDAFASVSLAIAFGTLEQIISNVATTGLLGINLFGFLGLALAADRYYNHKRNEVYAAKAFKFIRDARG